MNTPVPHQHRRNSHFSRVISFFTSLFQNKGAHKTDDSFAQVLNPGISNSNTNAEIHSKHVMPGAKEKYDFLFANMSQGVLYQSADGVIQSANPAALQMLGLTHQEIKGRTSYHSNWLVTDEVGSTLSPEKHPSMLALKSGKPVLDQIVSVVNQLTNEKRWLVTQAIPQFLENSAEPFQVMITFVDVTERIEVAHALQKSESRFRKILRDVQSIAVQGYQADGTTIYWNKASELLYGYTEEEALGRNLKELIIPEALQNAVTEGIKQMVESGVALPSSELVLKHKDGSEVNVYSGHTLILEKGRSAEFFCIDIDLADLKKAKAALIENEHYLQSVFRVVPTGIGIISNRIMQRVNPKFCEMTGYSMDELLGKSARMLYESDEEFNHVGAEKYRQIKETGTGVIETRWKRKDGSMIDVLLSSTPLNQEKLHESVTFTALDISERKETLRKLQASEEKYHQLFEANSDGIFIFTLDSSGYPSKLKEMNENAASMLGYTPEEIVGLTPDDFESNITAQKKTQRIEELREKGYLHFETSLMHKEGAQIYAEVKVLPVKISNEKAIMLILRDITSRKNNELQIAQYTAELSKQNAEKDRFFSIIAHDLRSPFNAFLGFTRMLEEELSSLTDDEIRKMAVSMRKSANLLFHLLENLLQWSRMQRGLISFSPEKFKLDSEIANCLELVIDAAAKKNISVFRHIPDDLYIVADAHMFESLIRNLIFNAIKFTPQGGEIHISAKAVRNQFAVISIKDTGIGMEKSLLEKLFRLDEQTHRKGTEGEPSTGLGLIICKDFVEKHGGKIWVESEKDKGSEFFITLPLPDAGTDLLSKNGNDKPQAFSAPLKQIKVLIVEDDPTSEMLLSRGIKAFCSVIYKASTGVQAVANCRKYPDIDLIMMDISIPEMDGYEATRQIRSFNKDIIIIGQSAFGMADDREKAIRAGCNDYISKPVNMNTLRKLIRDTFNL